jgi:hypothetical protein
MSRRTHTAAFVMAVLTLGLGVPASLRASASVQIADARCNSQTINDASARIRDYDRHSPGGDAAQLLARYGAIADVLATLNEEREILSSVCSADAQAPLYAKIAELTASALVLEANVAARLNASCAAAAKAFPTMMLADAWLTLANVVNNADGAVPPEFAGVTSRVQAEAQAVGFALPAWRDTSEYWRDQVHAKAKAAIATCPSPSPVPSTTQ